MRPEPPGRAASWQRGSILKGALGHSEEISELGELLGSELFALAALHRVDDLLDVSREVHRVERFRDVVEPARTETTSPVAHVCASGQEDDRDAARRLVLEEP